jgi:hypothetical protein
MSGPNSKEYPRMLQNFDIGVGGYTITLEKQVKTS